MIARFGDCEIDLDRLEVRSNGEVVAVEPQVFDVLSYLLEHRERLVTKEELLDNVWGDRFVTESALTSRIKSARRALGDNGRDQAVIRTVHGRGYQFIAEIEMTDRPPASTPAPAPSRQVDPPEADVPSLDDTWPLVGRHDELDQLDQLLTRDSGVLITGPASIGKTRLARVCLERARAADRTAAQISGHAKAEEIPLAALAHLLPPEILEAGSAVGELARTIVFQRARAAFDEMAAGERLVMMIDNADQLDEMSTALIASLIASRSIVPIMTQRTTAGEPLVFDELVRSGQIAHVDLGPLDDTDLDVLLYRVLAGPIDLDSLQQLTALSRGRPGALQQLVETCLATQALGRDAGVWRLTGPIQPTLGVPGPDQVVLSALPPGAATGAELLAVAHELDLELATQIIGADDLDVLDRSGLLTLLERPEGLRVAIAHAHLQILLTERLGPLRARRHKARLVDAMDLDQATDHDRMRRVRWIIETGSEPDLDEMLRSARFAVATAAGSTADVILDRLETTDAASEALHLRAELHFRRGQIDRADELLAAVDTTALDPAAAASVVRRRATIRFHVRARFDEALSLLTDAEADFDGDARELIAAHWVGLSGFLGHASDVLERVAEMPAGLPRAPRLEVLRGTAQAHLARGAFDDAIATLDRHDAEAQGLAAGAAQAGFEVALATRIATLTSSGDLRAASELVHRHLPVGRRTMLAWLPMAAARAELMAGRARVARELIRTPLAAVRSQNLVHAEPQMTGILAQTSVRVGDVDSARREIDGCRPLVDSLAGQLRWSLLLSIADVGALLEPEHDLVDLLVAAADDAAAAGARLAEAELLMAAARCGIAERVSARLSDVVGGIGGIGGIGGSLWSVRAQHARALASGDEVSLGEIAAAYARMGYVGYADSIARALDTPLG